MQRHRLQHYVPDLPKDQERRGKPSFLIKGKNRLTAIYRQNQSEVMDSMQSVESEVYLTFG